MLFTTLFSQLRTSDKNNCHYRKLAPGVPWALNESFYDILQPHYALCHTSAELLIQYSYNLSNIYMRAKNIAVGNKRTRINLVSAPPIFTKMIE